MIEGDARQLPRLLTTSAQDLLTGTIRRAGKLAHMAYGRVDLILTSPPYACEIADTCVDVRDKSEPLRRHDTTNYSPDRRNLGHARGDTYLTAMSEIYRVCAATLKPGGFLVRVTKNMRARGALRNLSGDTIALARAPAFSTGSTSSACWRLSTNSLCAPRSGRHFTFAAIAISSRSP